MKLCLLESFVGCGVTGQTVAIEGKIAKICYNGRLVPICGRYFWENNNGARLFCQMLGKKGGHVNKNQGIELTEDAYYAGKCSSTDNHITECSAGGNKHTLGGFMVFGTASCNKGQKAAISIKCDGKILLLYSQLSNKQK